MFKPEMIQAILECRKTVTRRVIDPQPDGPYIRQSRMRFYFRDKTEALRNFYPKYLKGETIFVKEAWQKDGKKMSTMFMPQSAARIFLTIEDVYPERLHDMPFEDIEKEGVISQFGLFVKHKLMSDVSIHQELKVRWKTLWNSVAKSSEFRHDKNPWVWVYRFSIKEVRK